LNIQRGNSTIQQINNQQIEDSTKLIQQLMSCFVVPLAQAVVTSAIRKSNEKNNRSDHSAFARHLPALEKMLWGGSVMLVVDHVINGELTWRFPFFTALENAGGGAVMLREMLTVGVPMSLVITAVWAVYALAKERKKKVQLT
jgi:hypothetical protein